MLKKLLSWEDREDSISDVTIFDTSNEQTKEIFCEGRIREYCYLKI